MAQSSFATAAHLGSISWLQPCTHCRLKHTQCNLQSDRPSAISAAWDQLAHTAVSGETGGQLHSLQQLLMLVPTLGDMSNATLKTACENMQADEQQEAGRIGQLEAVGHLMQLLTSMTPPQVQG